MHSVKEEEFNAVIGRRIMVARMSKKISREKLGAYIGVSEPQLFKYENGRNRIPIDKLAACAKFLEVPVSYFYGEEEDEIQKDFDKSFLSVAAEMGELPSEIRQTLHKLSRLVNKALEEKDEPEEDAQEKKI